MKVTTVTYGWHFVGKTLRDGSPIPPNGVWLEYPNKVAICSSGLHGSPTPWEALQHAPGDILCYNQYGDILDQQKDKFASNRRLILDRMNIKDTLRDFARIQALSCINNWKSPVPQVVLDYLNTGKEKYRSAAEYAAWSATESAAEYADRYAASSAAWSATESAASSAARSAARYAAWSAAEYADRYAARYAAWYAASSAARSAAWSATESAASSAAWSAARSAASKLFDNLIYNKFNEIITGEL